MTGLASLRTRSSTVCRTFPCDASSVTIRALREGLADAAGRACYGHESGQGTKNGKPPAALSAAEDFELLEQLETFRDIAEFRAAHLREG